jgi:hypothetical protein
LIEFQFGQHVQCGVYAQIMDSQPICPVPTIKHALRGILAQNACRGREAFPFVFFQFFAQFYSCCTLPSVVTPPASDGPSSTWPGTQTWPGSSSTKSAKSAAGQNANQFSQIAFLFHFLFIFIFFYNF